MKKFKIVLLFDLAEKISRDDYKLYWNNLEWKTEKNVKEALQSKGHEVLPYGLYDDLEEFLNFLKIEKPDLIFNLSEAYNGVRGFEPNVAAMIELLNIPFTGAKTKSLQLCKDKGLTKVILDHYGIKTPAFKMINYQEKKNKNSKNKYATISAQDQLDLKSFTFPAIVKPMQLESSEGISQNSVVHDFQEAYERIQFIHQKYKVDALIEEFIEGREVYVSVLGNDKLNVFPMRELFFKQKKDKEYNFATYKAKWDKNYRKKWGIDTGWASTLSQDLEKKITEECKKIYKLLQIQGFGRIDLRIRGHEIYFIEANPNPSISKKEDYALSARKAGIGYEDLIDRIVQLSVG